MSKYYKFVASFSAISSILDGRLKISPIGLLNDPMEVVPLIHRDQVIRSLKEIRKFRHTEEDLFYLQQQGAIMSLLAGDQMRTRIPRSVREADDAIRASLYDNIDGMIDFLRRVCKLMNERIGVFCVSKRYDSTAMWAYYANNRNGFVVEYVGLDYYFKGDDTGVLNSISNVVYEDDPIGMTIDPSTHRKLFLLKHPDWRHEREARLILPLSSCEPDPSLPENKFTYKIPTKLIRRIIVGDRVEKNQVEEIQREIGRKSPHTELCKVSIESRTIQISDAL